MIPALHEADVERFRAQVARCFGLDFDDGKLAFLAEVLRQRLVAGDNPFGSGDERPSGACEKLAALAEDLTVSETYFFRNIEQFRVLGEIALPERLRARAPQQPVRVLSAGCSSGEEAHSIVMTIEERFPEQPPARFRVDAVDLVPARVERAKRGRYPAWSLRETPEPLRTRWFRKKGHEFWLSERILERASFEVRNLADENATLWLAGAYDVVFCRNVLMYFAPEPARALIERITRALAPGGYLFLGHAETLRGLSQDFHLCHARDAFYYVRKDASLAAAQPVPAHAARLHDARGAEPSSLVAHSDSWAELIRRSSDRVQVLSERSTVPKPPADGRSSAPERARDLARAMELLGSERYHDALACVPSRPDSARDPETLLLRAVLLVHGGKLAEAEQVCRALLELEELHSGAHYVMALCRDAAGDGEGAGEHDRIAAHLDPAFAMPRLHLGLLARRGGELEVARRELARAHALLKTEEPSRLLLFGGGFGRDALVALCQAELAAAGGAP